MLNLSDINSYKLRSQFGDLKVSDLNALFEKNINVSDLSSPFPYMYIVVYLWAPAIQCTRTFLPSKTSFSIRIQYKINTYASSLYSGKPSRKLLLYYCLFTCHCGASS